MSTTFNFDEFKGYEFNCEWQDANTGFKHVCEVTKDYKTILSTEIHYLNRTWESYQFESVLDKAKDKLSKMLDTSLPKIDTEFLNRLACDEIIYDYGYIGDDDEPTIFFDGWYQVEGNKKYDDEKKEWVLTSKSAYAKLKELAEQGRLKNDYNYTILNTEFAFTDEYCRCDECGKWFNSCYGEISWVDELGIMICESCMSESDEVIDSKIESAVNDFRCAVPVSIDDNDLEVRGYTKVVDDLSCSAEQWGEKRLGYNYMSIDRAKDLCANYGGFAKLTSVQQFDTIFDLWFPDDVVDEVRDELGIE